VKPAGADKVTEPPWQNVSGPLAVIVGIGGRVEAVMITPAEGNEGQYVTGIATSKVYVPDVFAV
jgi:hypothetical protein